MTSEMNTDMKPAADAEMQETMKRARKLGERGRWLDAAREVHQFLAHHSGELTLWQTLADMLSRAGCFEQSIFVYRKIAGAYVIQGLPLKAMAVCKLIQRFDSEEHESFKAMAEVFGAGPGQATDMVTLPPALASASVVVAGPMPPLLWPISNDDIPDEDISGETEWELEDAPGPVTLQRSSLHQVPIFGCLPPDTFTALHKQVNMRVFPAGHAIVREGDPGDSLFILVQGSVDVCRPNDDGSLRTVAQMQDGAVFGEVALMTRAPRTATIVTTSDSILVEINRNRLSRVMATHPALSAILEKLYRERMIANILRASALFRSLSPETRDILSTRFHVRSVDAGIEILRQGEENDGLYLLLRGHCEAFSQEADGYREYPVLFEGTVFGEISLLWDRPITATIRALTPASLVWLARADFDQYVRTDMAAMESLRALGTERLARTAGVPLDISAS